MTATHGDPCPGRCNRTWRNPASITPDGDHLDEHHDVIDPTPGQPVWCRPCQDRIRQHLHRLIDLVVAVLAREDGRLNAGRDTNTTRTSTRTGSPSGSPAWDIVNVPASGARAGEASTKARDYADVAAKALHENGHYGEAIGALIAAVRVLAPPSTSGRRVEPTLAAPEGQAEALARVLCAWGHHAATDAFPCSTCKAVAPNVFADLAAGRVPGVRVVGDGCCGAIPVPGEPDLWCPTHGRVKPSGRRAALGDPA